jgi:hypothetical protein
LGNPFIEKHSLSSKIIAKLMTIICRMHAIHDPKKLSTTLFENQAVREDSSYFLFFIGLGSSLRHLVELEYYFSVCLYKLIVCFLLHQLKLSLLWACEFPL